MSNEASVSGLTFGSLFAGIGGFDLGFERAGMECRWQVEIDPYCQKVLAKHWPNIRRWSDIRKFPDADTIDDWRAIKVDVICGGFPCQDISSAGHGAGITGERSGLWFEFARIIRVLRPRFVVVENVPALLTRGIDAVLGSLAALGFDAEWECLPASAFGAPHRRDRIWIVAYAKRDGRQQGPEVFRRRESEPAACGEVVADATDATESEGRGNTNGGTVCLNVSNPDSIEKEWPSITWRQRGHWESEPDVGRVAHGVPKRVDRLRGLGNSVVPQIAEWIGRRIVIFEANSNT